MTEHAFETAYGKLNPGQKKAVDTIEGPVMVIAGPGTGKTQILALRIANILKVSDVPASAILALTFTESGVASMRKRLVSLIGARAYEVRLHTFHGFAGQVIARYPERFPRIVGADQIAELDALAIIERVLDNGSFELLRPVNKPYHNVKAIKGAIQDAKRENISPEMLLARIAAAEETVQGAEDLYHAKGRYKGQMKGAYADELRRLAKARETADVFARYETELTAAHRFDFEDTILEVVRALEADTELKLILQEEHQYLLADEHQDANGAQNRILELLSDFHDAPNLFVVGDEKQAIYRFQGASLENFLYFKRRYPDAVLIELEHNYRSTQVILDAAHDVIMPTRGDATVPRPKLEARAGHTHLPVAVRESRDGGGELQDLIASIKERIAAGTPACEIAVLLRRNEDVAHVAKALRRGGLVAASLGDADVLSSPLVRELIALLNAAAHFGQDSELYPLLFASFAELPNLDIFRLTEGRGARELYATLGDTAALKELKITDVERAHALFTLVDTVATAAKSQGLSDIAYTALEHSGLRARVAGSTDLGVELESLRAFLDFLEALEQTNPTRTIRDFMHELARAREYGISLVAAPAAREDAVRVMTAHKAKGMEFDFVFMPRANDARWGAKGRGSTITLPLYEGTEDTHDDDMRRLFYVAMTRARKELTLSYAATDERGKEHAPSRFLADIAPLHIEHVAVPLSASPLLVPPRGDLDLETLKAYVLARLVEQGLSVSALNNYLASPWKYFFVSLLRMPQRKEPYLHFGTAVDAGLKFHTQTLDATIDAAVLEFRRVFMRYPLAEADRKNYLKKGETMLRGYLSKQEEGPKVAAQAGVSVAVPFRTGIAALPELTLKGEFDRLEHLEDGRIRIVDWKTGKPKTRGEIEGTTKNSGGEYKRQLTFYALLESLKADGGRELAEATIAFIEPDAKGNYHRESYVITKEETEALTEVIRNALSEITTLAFLERECGADAWSEEGCALVQALKERLKRS